jgi:hypothetical protein
MHAGFVRVAAGLAAVATLAMASRAAADGFGDAWNNVSSIGAGATSLGDGGGALTGYRRTGLAPVCTFEALTPEEVSIADYMAVQGWSDAKQGDGPGNWLRKICGADASSPGTATVIWAHQKTDPRVLAERAVRDAELPVPRVVTSPPSDQPLVVNLPTWLSVDPAVWAPVSVSATAGAVTVAATAVPDRVVWDVGNSERVVCNGPGTRYNPSRPVAEQHPDCAYTYRRPGNYQITATVEWRVTWRAVGAPGGGDLGAARRSTTVPVRVAEIQALNRLPQQGG